MAYGSFGESFLVECFNESVLKLDSHISSCHSIVNLLNEVELSYNLDYE